MSFKISIFKESETVTARQKVPVIVFLSAVSQIKPRVSGVIPK